MNFKEKNILLKKAKCPFLLVMSFLSILLLFLLNVYITSIIFEYFGGDGFSFLGGFFIAFLYLFTIPALVFSVISVRLIYKEKKTKYIFPMIIGIMGVFLGIIFCNATFLWIYILAFSVVLLLSCLFCKKSQKRISNNEEGNLLEKKM